ncbi:hypothetical protein BGW36DRAFT_384373 [Talaromyces proteolyticus]|uniref:Uncharacterized protein n=1 Tax=Talaromyces proteolyticus TaxID=1131652 RepID=A0AAD4PW18_9EURO|nr:uncharacterized protein BGW36DRAFT_384373 [Talaromyces proteolyticus]KAH8694102.1 hypothetical protein BGW36DRAFT_384373 [Talaromyces proteolyticus]
MFSDVTYKIRFTLLLVPFSTFCHGWTTFDPQCTAPNESTNFVASAEVRGTMDIVWSCLSVLILCVWSIHHFCVPNFVKNESSSQGNWMKKALLANIKKLNWSLLAILAPEYIFAKALAEKLAAHYSYKQFQEHRQHGWSDWTITHAYFANMRGFVMRFNTRAVPMSLIPSKPDKLALSRQWPQQHSDVTYFEQDVNGSIEIERRQCREICGDPCQNRDGLASEKGSTIKTEHYLDAHKTWQGYWALSASQMLYACQQGIIAGPPAITVEELKDYSKSDIFVKVMAIVQITWLVVQILARVTQNLAVTLLEITVLAFAAVMIATYLLLLGKPQDVHVATLVDARGQLNREQVIGLAARSPQSTLFVHGFWLHGVAVRTMSDNVFPYSPSFSIKLPWMTRTHHLDTVIMGMGFGGAIFGSVHCAAWNAEFPTSVERLLWRISCIVLIALPPVSVFTYDLVRYIFEARFKTNSKAKHYLKPIGYSTAPVYLLARLYLLVETFRSLAYLSPSAFQAVSWSSIVPHL